MSAPLVPDYGNSTLADLLPSLGAHLGMPGGDRIGLPPAERYVVLLIDGLGADLLAENAERAPFLSGLTQRFLTSGVPSTTATSITSLGTGLPPGAHGIAGYSFWHRPEAAVLNTLRWPAGLSGLDVQPQLTYFERTVKAGIHTGTIAPANFAQSGLTTVALRGATFWPVRDETDLNLRAELAVSAVMAGERNLTYCYERVLDHTGHGRGVDSDRWRDALGWVDRLAFRMREVLPQTVRLVITADHGMIDVPEDSRVLVEDEPGLLDEVGVFAGEGRLRHLMVETGSAERVAGRWRRRLGERAWVRTRDEAIAEGWFGDMATRHADRFGDVIVAMADDGAILSRTLAGELGLVGMHGSLTHAEMVVPLLVE
jgi:hypothetical protein